MPTLLTDVRWFEAQFVTAEDGPQVTTQLFSLLGSILCQGKQIHEANIVATMLVHGVLTLLTHNVADFTRFSGQIRILALV